MSDTTLRAIELMRAMPSGVPLPDVVVNDDGSIELDWDDATDCVASVTLKPDGSMGYAALIGGLSESTNAASIDDVVLLMAQWTKYAGLR